MLARLHRAGELTEVWVPDAAHEAMRDLERARAIAAKVLSKARQHLSGFLLRHGMTYSGVRTCRARDGGLHLGHRAPGSAADDGLIGNEAVVVTAKEKVPTATSPGAYRGRQGTVRECVS